MRVVIFVDNDDKNQQIKKTIIMMMIIKKSHKPMIGCLHVGQLDNLGLQLEHTGWPERHWVEMKIIQEVKNKNKNRRLKNLKNLLWRDHLLSADWALKLLAPSLSLDNLRTTLDNLTNAMMLRSRMLTTKCSQQAS